MGLNIYKKAMQDYDYTNNRVVVWLVKLFCLLLSILIVFAMLK